MKTAVLLVNVGTPDKPEIMAVRRYLTQFLNDRRVIDIPWLLQKLLVNLIIVPFRSPKSTKLYKLLWSKNGSPLLFYTNKLKEKLQKKLPGNYTIYIAMRYGNPSLNKALASIEKGGFDEVIVLPQFPQYASSSTGTVNEYVMNRIKKWNNTPTIKFINQFYDHQGYVAAFAKRAIESDYQSFDHIVFSYHGLPIRQINKTHPGIDCSLCSCNKEMPAHGKWCYKASCYQTSRLLADKLGLQTEQFTVAFQSRLSKNWLEPFSDKVIVDLAHQGKKRILFLAPAFVADCLETEVEIGIEYAELFKAHGGQELVMAKSLNDMDEWIDALKTIIIE
jgi:protoporphyrin/coproporphyrin ferrochelatase